MPGKVTLSILCIDLLLPHALTTPAITPVEDPLWGKWKGLVKIKEAESPVELDFKSDGTLEMKVLGSVVTSRYRIRDIHRLELIQSLPDGQGGVKDVAVEIPYRVTPGGLELGLETPPGFRMPEKLQRIKSPF